MTTATATAPRKGRRRRFSPLSRGDKLSLGGMVGIPALFVFVLIWVPVVLTAVVSFTNWNGARWLKWENIGFRNFWNVFDLSKRSTYPALFNNIVLLVFLAACSMIGILFAYLLDKNIRGSRIYQSIYYMPVVLSLAVVGFMWKSIMWSPEQGLFNVVLGRTAQGDQIDWVGDSDKIGWTDFNVPFLGFDLGVTKNFAAILIAMAWRHIGYVMVIYLAGLKAVDPALREAAAIDGCTEVQSFRRVVFPVMRPINVVVLVITVIEALRAFDIIVALDEPTGTAVLGTLVRKNAGGESTKIGLGSAYGMFLLLLCVVFIIWYLRNQFREDEAS
jgi:multiple sugar transport system permease protein